MNHAAQRPHHVTLTALGAAVLWGVIEFFALARSRLSHRR